MTIYTAPDARALGKAAAEQAAVRLRRLADELTVVPVLFATGVSQLHTLRALTEMPHIPWDRIVGFHMDEYLGIAATHPASFRHYLQKELVCRVAMRAFRYIEGDGADPLAVCAVYAAELRQHPPRLCLLGIGENGHLAFNDPGEARFDDPEQVRIVKLDQVCRAQQLHEGWFGSIDDVPREAITLTIPALMAVPEIIASVPGVRKASIVRRFLFDSVSPDLPATVLRNHPNVTIYLDSASAALAPELNVDANRQD